MARRDVVQLLKQDVAGERRSFFLPAPVQSPIQIASAPARLDVLGGLGVQVGGTVAQMALPRRVAVAVQRTDEPLLKIQSDQIAPPLGDSLVEIRTSGESLSQCSGATAWAAPILALWQVLAQAFPTHRPNGTRILISSDIPMHAGQASSTALLTALVLALSNSRQNPPADPTTLANLIRQAETLCHTGGPGAAVDAMTCLLAEQPHPQPHFPTRQPPPPRGGLMRYSAQPLELIGHVPLPANLRILALDTGVRYNAAAQPLDELRLAGAMGLTIIETIYRDLGQSHTPLHGYLANTSPLLYRQYFRALLPRRLRGSDFIRTYGPLPENAGLDPAGMYRVRTAVDHFIAENEHAEQFLQAIEELSERTPAGAPAMNDLEERQRTLQRAGRLALASHHSYRLRLEMSCREADWLVDHLMEAGPDRGIYGARITAAGGGGTIMALVDQSTPAGDAVLETIDAYTRVTGLSLAIVEAGGIGSEGALLANAKAESAR